MANHLTALAAWPFSTDLDLVIPSDQQRQQMLDRLQAIFDGTTGAPIHDEQIWTLLLTYGYREQPGRLYRALTGDETAPTSCEAWLEMQPLSPRKGVRGCSEGNTNVDLSCGSIATRGQTRSGLQYDGHPDGRVCLVEAKWLSDIAGHTHHDFHRNQLARVIETALTLQHHDRTNAPAGSKRGRWPGRVHVALLTPREFQPYQGGSRFYAYKFREYDSDRMALLDDIGESELASRPSDQDGWQYPGDLMERIRDLSLHWATYEDLFEEMPADGGYKEALARFVAVDQVKGPFDVEVAQRFLQSTATAVAPTATAGAPHAPVPDVFGMLADLEAGTAPAPTPKAIQRIPPLAPHSLPPCPRPPFGGGERVPWNLPLSVLTGRAARALGTDEAVDSLMKPLLDVVRDEPELTAAAATGVEPEIDMVRELLECLDDDQVPCPDLDAWYQSLHDHGPDDWGIYIRVRAVIRIATGLARIAHASGLQPGVPRLLAAPALKLLHHEMFHHRVEGMATRMQAGAVATGVCVYRQYKDEYYGPSFGGDLCFEEGLANAHALTRLDQGAVKSVLGAELSELASRFFRAVVEHRSPPGYRRGVEFVDRTELGERVLLELMKDAAKAPGRGSRGLGFCRDLDHEFHRPQRFRNPGLGGMLEPLVSLQDVPVYLVFE